MKILIVNTFDTGGAANACIRLHEGLLRESIDSSLLLKEKNKNIEASFKFKPIEKKLVPIRLLNKIRKKIGLKNSSRKVSSKTKIKNQFLEERSVSLEYFSFPESDFDIIDSELYKAADVINLHWTAFFLDYKSFFKKNKKPVVWTLHDMNPFSGGEHYEEEIFGIDSNGYPLQRNRIPQEITISKKNIQLKKKILKNVQNLTIVAPSQWLAEEARKSDVFFSKPVHCIPYGLDSEIFILNDKESSRDLLGLPQNKTVILFVADNLNNHRKGFEYLIRAFEHLQLIDIVLCAIGDKNEALSRLTGVIMLGRIEDAQMMSKVYSAADVMVIPSLMDNLPNTVLESLLCGTPVIGFPVGGITDMVSHLENGILTNEISVSALAGSIMAFLKHGVSQNRSTIRTKAIEKYDSPVQANAYINLFKSVINK